MAEQPQAASDQVNDDGGDESFPTAAVIELPTSKTYTLGELWSVLDHSKAVRCGQARKKESVQPRGLSLIGGDDAKAAPSQTDSTLYPLPLKTRVVTGCSGGSDMICQDVPMSPGATMWVLGTHSEERVRIRDCQGRELYEIPACADQRLEILPPLAEHDDSIFPTLADAMQHLRPMPGFLRAMAGYYISEGESIDCGDVLGVLDGGEIIQNRDGVECLRVRLVEEKADDQSPESSDILVPLKQKIDVTTKVDANSINLPTLLERACCHDINLPVRVRFSDTKGQSSGDPICTVDEIRTYNSLTVAIDGQLAQVSCLTPGVEVSIATDEEPGTQSFAELSRIEAETIKYIEPSDLPAIGPAVTVGFNAVVTSPKKQSSLAVSSDEAPALPPRGSAPTESNHESEEESGIDPYAKVGNLYPALPTQITGATRPISMDVSADDNTGESATPVRIGDPSGVQEGEMDDSATVPPYAKVNKKESIQQPLSVSSKEHLSPASPEPVTCGSPNQTAPGNADGNLAEAINTVQFSEGLPDGLAQGEESNESKATDLLAVNDQDGLSGMVPKKSISQPEIQTQEENSSVAAIEDDAGESHYAKISQVLPANRSLIVKSQSCHGAISSSPPPLPSSPRCGRSSGAPSMSQVPESARSPTFGMTSSPQTLPRHFDTERQPMPLPKDVGPYATIDHEQTKARLQGNNDGSDDPMIVPDGSSSDSCGEYSDEEGQYEKLPAEGGFANRRKSRRSKPAGSGSKQWEHERTRMQDQIVDLRRQLVQIKRASSMSLPSSFPEAHSPEKPPLPDSSDEAYPDDAFKSRKASGKDTDSDQRSLLSPEPETERQRKGSNASTGTYVYMGSVQGYISQKDELKNELEEAKSRIAKLEAELKTKDEQMAAIQKNVDYLEKVIRAFKNTPTNSPTPVSPQTTPKTNGSSPLLRKKPKKEGGNRHLSDPGSPGRKFSFLTGRAASKTIVHQEAKESLADEAKPAQKLNGSPASSTPMDSFTPDDVLKFLQEAGLGKYEDKFREVGCTGERLARATSESLEDEFEVFDLTDRQKMLSAIERFCISGS